MPQFHLEGRTNQSQRAEAGRELGERGTVRGKGEQDQVLGGRGKNTEALGATERMEATRLKRWRWGTL